MNVQKDKENMNQRQRQRLKDQCNQYLTCKGCPMQDYCHTEEHSSKERSTLDSLVVNRLINEDQRLKTIISRIGGNLR